MLKPFSVFAENALISRLSPRCPIWSCFSKTRVVLNPTSAKKGNKCIELLPLNKLRTLAKLAHLPPNHVQKALSTKVQGSYYVCDKWGDYHCFSNEKDIIVPYDNAESYLFRCKKTCRCKEIDPENPNCINDQLLSPDFKRNPVIGVVGEMDHGKTTLLDYLQGTHVQKEEYGGTTQVIRANAITLTHNEMTCDCTFLDTPGQTCFSFIRENGSILSDYSLYVISQCEGPSEEAKRILKQLEENNNPVVIVYTKADLVSEERRREVMEKMRLLIQQYHITLLDSLSISCVNGEGMDVLQQRLIQYCRQYQKDVILHTQAEATILDSLVIPTQGILLRALIQQGCLSIRDEFICGLYTGRVRSLTDSRGHSIPSATPGIVVSILGARKLPAVLRKNPQLLPTGNTLFVRSAEEIRELWDYRMVEYSYRNSLSDPPPEEGEGLESDFKKEEYEEVKMQSVIVIADNANSAGIILSHLSKYENVSVLFTRIGQICDKDIDLCKSKATRIISFNVSLPTKASIAKERFLFSRLMSELLEEVDSVYKSSV